MDLHRGILREIDAAIATQIFDWQWYLFASSGQVGLVPPKTDEWISWGVTPDATPVKMPWKYKRLSNWDQLGGDRHQHPQRGIPKYSTDDTAAWTVVRKMTQRMDYDSGFTWQGPLYEPKSRLDPNLALNNLQSASYAGTGVWYIYLKIDHKIIPSEYSTTPALAVCLSALKVAAHPTNRPFKI